MLLVTRESLAILLASKRIARFRLGSKKAIFVLIKASSTQKEQIKKKT